MKKIAFILLPACLAITAVKAQQTAPPKKMKLIWADEFNYFGHPDPKKWGYETGFIRNNEPQYYTNKRLENCRVENGSLVIEAIKEVFTDTLNKGGKQANYTSASINTLGKFSFLYGRVEVRAKLPKGKGIWPAIWMMGDNMPEVNWPTCGEIDIMEFLGKDTSQIYATVHYRDTTAKAYNAKQGMLKDIDPASGFHLYALEWYKDRLDFYFDDKKFFTFDIKDSQVGGFNPFQKKHYFLLNLAVGHEPSWPGPIDDAILPIKYLVDYVRIYTFSN